MIIRETIDGTEVELETGDYYFSPKNVDRGTLRMLAHAAVSENDKVLDLGCGYGVAGVYMAKKIGGERIVMCDILPEAVELSNANLARNGIIGTRVIQSDGLKSVSDNDFTVILSNPPYHTDFSVAKAFLEEGYKKLVLGGRMFLVTKRLDWYRNKMESVFGGVKVYEEDGYYIFVSEKRKKNAPKGKKNTNTMSKKLQRKYGKQIPAKNRK